MKQFKIKLYTLSNRDNVGKLQSKPLINIHINLIHLGGHYQIYPINTRKSGKISQPDVTLTDQLENASRQLQPIFIGYHGYQLISESNPKSFFWRISLYVNFNQNNYKHFSLILSDMTLQLCVKLCKQIYKKAMSCFGPVLHCHLRNKHELCNNIALVYAYVMHRTKCAITHHIAINQLYSMLFFQILK